MQNNLYSFSKFGRDAEFIIANYLKLRGWNVNLSKGSRGPADLIATKNLKKWLIQVKSSTVIPRLKSYEIERLNQLAKLTCGVAVLATLQPVQTVQQLKQNHAESQGPESIILGNYIILFYSILDWQNIIP